MEMEDHHHRQQQQQPPYVMADLRQLMSNGARSIHFPSIPTQQSPTVELFPGHRHLTPTTHHHHYEMMMLGRQVSDILPHGGLDDFASSDTTPAATASCTTPPMITTTAASASTPPLSGFDADTTGCLGGDASTGRWPRQETLTLLDIRSRLDRKFKEANQKGPLWDEVSRIMCEEHGYQRSGRKCREKFENLYKYYKKTKEGKAGRQDGKHYRFFRQLEALYGENNPNPNPMALSIPEDPTNFLHFQKKSTTGHHFNPLQTNQDMFHSPHTTTCTTTTTTYCNDNRNCDSLSLTNSTDDQLDTSSSEDKDFEDNNMNGSAERGSRKRRGSGGRRSWKIKIKEFIDSQMRKLVEKQEAWLERLMKTLEQKEKERAMREEEWRKQEAQRLEKEHMFWAKERAWIEARDAALMEALNKVTGKESLNLIASAVAAEPLNNNSIEKQRELNQNEEGSDQTLNNSTTNSISWKECEASRLLQLRAEMESRFGERGGCSEEDLWEEIAAKMACLGYDNKTASMCKDKWMELETDHIYPFRNMAGMNIKTKEGNNSNNKNKKRKENCISNPRSCCYLDQQSSDLYMNQERMYCDQSQGGRSVVRANDHHSSPSPSNSNAGNSLQESCLPFLMGEEENLWDNYGLKLSKTNQSQ